MKPEILNPSNSKHLETQINAETCLNCGENLVGDYCHKCGEKPLSHHDLTIKHFFLHTVVHEFTHLNGSIFQTLKLLIVKPGFLAKEYFSGRKSRYINPLRLYLTLSLVFFFASSLGSEGNSSIKGIAESEPTGFLSRTIEEKTKTVDLESEVIRQKIHDKTKTLNGILGLTQVLFISLAFMAVYYTSRQYYVEHLVLALYFVSFFFIVLITLSLLWIIFIKIINLISPSESVYYIVSRGVHFWIPLGILAAYLLFAFRTFYKSSIARAAIGIPFVLIVSILTQNILSWIAILLIVLSI
jgi:hypothetical protein